MKPLKVTRLCDYKELRKKNRQDAIDKLQAAKFAKAQSKDSYGSDVDLNAILDEYEKDYPSNISEFCRNHNISRGVFFRAKDKRERGQDPNRSNFGRTTWTDEDGVAMLSDMSHEATATRNSFTSASDRDFCKALTSVGTVNKQGGNFLKNLKAPSKTTICKYLNMVSPESEPVPSTINARRQEAINDVFNPLSSIAIVGAILGVSPENPQGNRFHPWNKTNSDTHNITLGYSKKKRARCPKDMKKMMRRRHLSAAITNKKKKIRSVKCTATMSAEPALLSHIVVIRERKCKELKCFKFNMNGWVQSIIFRPAHRNKQYTESKTMDAADTVWEDVDMEESDEAMRGLKEAEGSDEKEEIVQDDKGSTCKSDDDEGLIPSGNEDNYCSGPNLYKRDQMRALREQQDDRDCDKLEEAHATQEKPLSAEATFGMFIIDEHILPVLVKNRDRKERTLKKLDVNYSSTEKQVPILWSLDGEYGFISALIDVLMGKWGDFSIEFVKLAAAYTMCAQRCFALCNEYCKKAEFYDPKTKGTTPIFLPYVVQYMKDTKMDSDSIATYTNFFHRLPTMITKCYTGDNIVSGFASAAFEPFDPEVLLWNPPHICQLSTEQAPRLLNHVIPELIQLASLRGLTRDDEISAILTKHNVKLATPMLNLNELNIIRQRAVWLNHSVEAERRNDMLRASTHAKAENAAEKERKKAEAEHKMVEAVKARERRNAEAVV